MKTVEDFRDLIGDKFVVFFKDGTERTCKHIYGGITELCDMLDMSTVDHIIDI